MILLVEQSRLPASPETVWSWFRELDTRYTELHTEHLAWRTLRGEPLSDGAIVFVDEWIGPMRLSGRSFIGDVEPGRRFTFRFGFPASLLRAGGSFAFEPTSDGGCEMKQEVRLGFALPLIGALIDRALGLVLPLGDLRRHMREEHENLLRLLEAPTEPGLRG